MPEVRYCIGSDYPVLSAFMQCRAPVSVCRGPLGSGKTIATIQRLLDHMCQQHPNSSGVRPTRFLAIRNTYPDLAETTIKDFLEIFEPFGKMRMGGLEPPNFQARFVLPDGTKVEGEVIFLALDRPDAIKKLKGYQVTGIWWNEMSEISKPFVDMGDLRHGRYPSDVSGGVRCSWHGMFGDTNSFHDSHWMYKVREQRPQGWEFFDQPGGVIDTGETNADGRKIWKVNPRAENAENLPPDYYSRGMQGKDDDWIAVMLANEFGFMVDGKPVHPRFVDSLHTHSGVIEPNERYPLLVGIDFGRTPAATIGQFWSHVGRHVCIDELVSFDMSAAIFAPELKRKLDREYPGMAVRAWGDPAGDAAGQATEDTPIRIVRAAGIPCEPTETNIAAVRRAALDNPLTRLCVDGKPAYKLSGAKCPNLRRSLAGGYHYRQLKLSGEARYSDIPEKNDDSHVCFVAGTRISTPSGKRAIESLRVGDHVDTPVGPRRIVYAMSRVSECLDLLLSDGTQIGCTPDHPFMTGFGCWARADALEYSDILLHRESPKWIQRLCLRVSRERSIASSSSIVSATTGGLRAATTRAVTATETVTCIVWPGLVRMVRYLMDTMSTTSMGTRRTIASVISSALSSPSTTAVTCSPLIGESGPSVRSALQSRELRSGARRTLNAQQRSEGQECASSGGSVSALRQSMCSALTAEISSQRTSGTRIDRSTARSRASQRLEWRLALTMWMFSAWCALRRFGATSTESRRPVRVLAREKLSRGLVYNIEVDDAHCYYAQGVLVSNCEAEEYRLQGAGEGKAALRPSEPQIMQGFNRRIQVLSNW